MTFVGLKLRFQYYVKMKSTHIIINTNYIKSKEKETRKPAAAVTFKTNNKV